MIKRFFTLNTIFALYLIVFIAIVTGLIPRETALVAVVLMAVWMLWRPLEDGVLFFVRSVPLFIALPLTSSYDNLNMWRPLAIVIFIRYLLQKETRNDVVIQWQHIRHATGRWLKEHSVSRRLLLLTVLAILSLIGAAHPMVGGVRIIYFVNLSLVPTVVFGLVRRKTLSTELVIRSIAISAVVVIAAGFIQLISTYLMDVYQFMRLWGEDIQLRQFGTRWSYIAVNVGNTWLAYYGDQLSLRVFSLFPDSHSFPTFVLLGIPALFAVGLGPILNLAREFPVRALVRRYAHLSILWIPLAYLAAILSGTRGIWASFLGVAALAIILVWWFRRTGADVFHRRIFSYMALYLTVFVFLFGIAWPTFISPQFLVGKSNANLFGHRLRSILDFGETSNGLRLQIWKSTIHSIVRHPVLGVGIGNFPVVLDQDIKLARAGSTAHNLYLHVAAEMGIFAGLELIVLLGAAWLSAIRWFRSADGLSVTYAGAVVLYLPWVLLYVLTDPIIFDERVFLLFGTTLALIWANRHD